MQKILSNIVLILVFILFGACLYLYNRGNTFKDERDQEKTAKEFVIAKCDSILALPPDTFYTEPEFVKGDDSIVYITRWKNNPNKPILEPQIYQDSIINDSIDIRLKIYACGLDSIRYDYKPIFKYQEKIIEKYVPKYVDVVKEIKVNQPGLFMNAGLGYADDFVGKVGLMYLTKKNSTFSYDFVRYGNQNIHIASYGVKF